MSNASVSPHYVRFARSLALTTSLVLPACGGSVDPSVTSDPAATREPTEPSASNTRPTSTDNAGAAPAAPSPSVGPIGLAHTAEREALQTFAVADDAAAPPDASYANPYATDAGQAFKSGPLPPPELPLERA